MKRYLGVDLHRTQFTVCTRLETEHSGRHHQAGQTRAYLFSAVCAHR
jgi:hypothetical protein